MTVEGDRKGVGLRERTEDREARRDKKMRTEEKRGKRR